MENVASIAMFVSLVPAVVYALYSWRRDLLQHILLAEAAFLPGRVSKRRGGGVAWGGSSMRGRRGHAAHHSH